MANSNAATITKVPDGDFSIGSLNGEQVTLVDAAAAYVTGGYPFVSQAAVNNAGTGNINIDIWKICTVQPWGGQGGYFPVWNPVTQKLQIFQPGAATTQATEVPAGTDLSAFTFLLAVIGL